MEENTSCGASYFLVFIRYCKEDETCGHVAGIGKLGNMNLIRRNLNEVRLVLPHMEMANNMKMV
jgi:hypothetical protein